MIIESDLKILEEQISTMKRFDILENELKQKRQEKLDLERLSVDPAIETKQCQRLENLRARRDSQRVNDLLSQLDSAARSKRKLMPLFIKCVESDVTLGEICRSLRQVWGEYQPPAWI